MDHCCASESMNTKKCKEAAKEASHPIRVVKRCIYDHQSVSCPSCNQHARKHDYRLPVWMVCPHWRERMDLIVCAASGPVHHRPSATDHPVFTVRHFRDDLCASVTLDPNK